MTMYTIATSQQPLPLLMGALDPLKLAAQPSLPLLQVSCPFIDCVLATSPQLLPLLEGTLELTLGPLELALTTLPLATQEVWWQV